MSFLRLGASCVVINEQNRVLLSQRADLKTWSIPGGRLDRGETLADCAIRETREETGIEAEIIRPVGLYFRPGWYRMNVVFLARKTGGTLLGETHETLDNRFFPMHDLPAQPHTLRRIRHALNGETVLRETPYERSELRRLKRKFALRYVRNLLAGRPEPRYPRFDVQAVAVIGDGNGRILASGESRLPSVICDGNEAPWVSIQRRIVARYGVNVALEWRGISENPAQGGITLIFRNEKTLNDHNDLIYTSRLDKRHKQLATHAESLNTVFQISVL